MIVVIGGGQSGLSAGYHLKRRGLDFVVLDADRTPGGAWSHCWESLRMATVQMTGTQVTKDPRVHLIGFGPSQSTVGANRAGRAAVGTLVKFLDQQKAAA